MDFSDIKRKSHIKVVVRGKSGRGKTITCVKVALILSRRGYDVLYVDTEAEGSTTIVELVEGDEFEESDVENLEYVQVSSYQELKSKIEHEVQRNYDLVIVDTLDHKHTFAIDKVTDERSEPGADWNEYPQIYSHEKQIMELLGKPKANILCSIDPESGSMDKPKGTQTNVHGYFTLVIDMTKSGEEWANVIRNYVGNGAMIGNGVSQLPENLAEKIEERSER